MTALTTHTAPGQALGYFFQLDRALCQIAKAPSGSVIGIETEDDIVVKLLNGDKIHEQDKSSTTVFPFIPSKPDLWKSLVIWADGILNEEINPDITQFYLVTNKNTAECIAKTISDAKEDSSITNCLIELKKYKNTSNQATKRFIDELFSFSDDILKKLIKNTSLICGEELIGDSLKNDLFSLFQIVDGDEDEKLNVIHQIYGWLFTTVRTAWQNKQAAWIDRDVVIRLKNKILEKRIEQFINERIFESGDISELDKKAHQLKTYVKQLRLINSDDSEIIEAITDYFNSSEKRTLLAKKGYVTGMQMDIMLQDLRKRWKTIYRRVPLTNRELSKEEQGKLICLDTLDHNTKIGNMETQSYFLTRGTYHDLADSLEVGWHPDYETLINNE